MAKLLYFNNIIFVTALHRQFAKIKRHRLMALRGLFLHLFSVFSNRQTFLILALTTNGM